MNEDVERSIETGVRMREKPVNVDVIHYTGDNELVLIRWVLERGGKITQRFITPNGKFTDQNILENAKVFTVHHPKSDSECTVYQGKCVVFNEDKFDFSVTNPDSLYDDYEIVSNEKTGCIRTPNEHHLPRANFIAVRGVDVCDAIVVREDNVEEVQEWVKARGGSSKNLPLDDKVWLQINDPRSVFSKAVSAGSVIIFRNNEFWIRSVEGFTKEFVTIDGSNRS